LLFGFAHLLLLAFSSILACHEHASTFDLDNLSTEQLDQSENITFERGCQVDLASTKPIVVL